MSAPSRPTSRRSVLTGLVAVGAGLAGVQAGGIGPAVAQVAASRPGAKSPAERLVDAAESQIGVTTLYDPAYVRLVFPGGDVPVQRGVCTDVVVRAYRAAFGFDLQAHVNADMRRAFAVYPRRWGLAGPDPNIDHRRVPNLQTFLARRGAELRRADNEMDAWLPGDIVTQLVAGGRPHIGIVSATRVPSSGRLLVVHNIGRGTLREDILDVFVITGRYRFLAPA